MLTTREAEPADRAAIARLWSTAIAARLTELGVPPAAASADPAADPAAAEQQVAARLAAPGSFAVLAAEDGDLVAAAVVLSALTRDGAGTDPVPGLAHVSMVAVRPDRWGRGLAAVVLRRVLVVTRERGFDRVQLWTHETNRRAQRLYERLGWTASGRAKDDDRGERIRHYVRDL